MLTQNSAPDIGVSLLRMKGRQENRGLCDLVTNTADNGACACAIQQEFVIPVTDSQVFTADSMSLTSKLPVNAIPVLVPRFSSTPFIVPTGPQYKTNSLCKG